MKPGAQYHSGTFQLCYSSIGETNLTSLLQALNLSLQQLIVSYAAQRACHLSHSYFPASADLSRPPHPGAAQVALLHSEAEEQRCVKFPTALTVLSAFLQVSAMQGVPQLQESGELHTVTTCSELRTA